VAAGPGLREDEGWLADLRRESLPESLLAGGTITAAAATEHAHKLQRALNAEVTALCLVTGALFPVLGYDAVLALVFGMPGLPIRPGTPVPAGPACPKARERSGEAPARAMSGHDAARDGIPAGPDGTAFGLEITQIDGTTLELFNDPLLADASGTPSAAARPLFRLAGLPHSGTRRWKAAVIGRYLDGENALADGLAREGARRLDLNVLAPADAVGLLRALIGGRVDNDLAAAMALASQCCWLPLALRVAGELAAASPAVSLAALVGELAEPRRRLDLLDAGRDPRTGIRAMFFWSGRCLESAAWRAFRLLGKSPVAHFDRYSIAALCGTTVREADGRAYAAEQADIRDSADERERR